MGSLDVTEGVTPYRPHRNAVHPDILNPIASVRSYRESLTLTVERASLFLVTQQQLELSSRSLSGLKAIRSDASRLCVRNLLTDPKCLAAALTRRKMLCKVYTTESSILSKRKPPTAYERDIPAALDPASGARARGTDLPFIIPRRPTCCFLTSSSCTMCQKFS